ncbi:MAG: hypothetical protein P9X22_03650, partial [Candidatus Zapsychrus exili]|nr:hypothetical protein [Candidatus Zapsychrus exili]
MDDPDILAAIKARAENPNSYLLKVKEIQGLREVYVFFQEALDEYAQTSGRIFWNERMALNKAMHFSNKSNVTKLRVKPIAGQTIFVEGDKAKNLGFNLTDENLRGKKGDVIFDRSFDWVKISYSDGMGIEVKFQKDGIKTFKVGASGSKSLKSVAIKSFKREGFVQEGKEDQAMLTEENLLLYAGDVLKDNKVNVGLNETAKEIIINYFMSENARRFKITTSDKLASAVGITPKAAQIILDDIQEKIDYGVEDEAMLVQKEGWGNLTEDELLKINDILSESIPLGRKADTARRGVLEVFEKDSYVQKRNSLGSFGVYWEDPLNDELIKMDDNKFLLRNLSGSISYFFNREDKRSPWKLLSADQVVNINLMQVPSIDSEKEQIVELFKIVDEEFSKFQQKKVKTVTFTAKAGGKISVDVDGFKGVDRFYSFLKNKERYLKGDIAFEFSDGSFLELSNRYSYHYIVKNYENLYFRFLVGSPRDTSTKYVLYGAPKTFVKLREENNKNDDYVVSRDNVLDFLRIIANRLNIESTKIGFRANFTNISGLKNFEKYMASLNSKVLESVEIELLDLDVSISLSLKPGSGSLYVVSLENRSGRRDRGINKVVKEAYERTVSYDSILAEDRVIIEPISNVSLKTAKEVIEEIDSFEINGSFVDLNIDRNHTSSYYAIIEDQDRTALLFKYSGSEDKTFSVKLPKSIDKYYNWDAIKDAILKELKDVKSDKAMISETATGGIDLNPAYLDMQIKRDGAGVPLPLDMQVIETMKIEGFIPVIINITPITNFPLLLGMGADDEEENETQELSLGKELEPAEEA